MRALIQRVKKGSVEVDNKIISTIDQGIVLFIGIENADTNLDIEWICKKVSQLRIFDDENKIMNKSLMDNKRRSIGNKSVYITCFDQEG